MLTALSILVGIGAASMVVAIATIIVSIVLVVLVVVGTTVTTAPPFMKAASEAIARRRAVFVGWFAVLFLGGVFGIGANRARAEAERADRDLCLARIKEVTAVKGDPTLDEAARLRDRAKEGRDACEAAGLTREAGALGIVVTEIERQLTAQRQAQAPTTDTATPATTALDPTRCPKGKVLIDANTKKTVRCTGPASEAPGAGDDDEDVKARCRELEKWDGVTFIRCGALPNGHRGIDIVLTNSAWEFLGENGKHRMFANAALASFKEHWSKFHGWKGTEPADHQVHLYRAGGMTPETFVASISAGGLYMGE
jgi:hypothetical protein